MKNFSGRSGIGITCSRPEVRRTDKIVGQPEWFNYLFTTLSAEEISGITSTQAAMPFASPERKPETRVNDSIHVLYVVYWGVMEPLGQSLVLPQVLKFAAAGLQITLVTFREAPPSRRRETVPEPKARGLPQGRG